MKNETRGKASLALSVAALLIALTGAGGAAVAAAIVANSDRVDGFHAVGAGASDNKRKGKLVATDSSGDLPSGAIPSSAAWGSEIPGGLVLVGLGGVETQSVGSGGDYGTYVDFGGALSYTPTVIIVPFSTTTSQCQGSYAAPTAVPGYGCVYLNTPTGITVNVAAVLTPNTGMKVSGTSTGSANADLTFAFSYAVNTSPLI